MGLLNLHPETLALFRKELHRNPELSGYEEQTAKRVVAFLQNYQPDEIITNIGGHGVAAIYKGKKSGKTTLFRCELDALPIQETNEFDYKSNVDGISHKCGHDGHIAILCGLAAILSADRPKKGAVVLLFQPAEEDGSGAEKVYNDSKFKQLEPDNVFALHNLPGFPEGQIIVKNGTFSCAVKSVIIKLSGITSHAGEPENGVNPALAISEIINAFNSMIQPDLDRSDYFLLTPIHIRMGEKAYGVSAGDAEVHYTIRSSSNHQMDLNAKLLEEIIVSISSHFKLKSAVEWIQPFRANENSPKAVDMIRKAAEEEQLEILEKSTPFSWGEDFGIFTEHYTGAMFGLGAGINVPALHNPDYDYPDEISSTGISIFYKICQAIHHA